MYNPIEARKNTDTDRAKTPRVHERVPMDGRALVHDESRLFIAPIRNISAGGVYIDLLVSVPVGREVKIIIKSSSLPQSIAVTGTVVRVDYGPRMGLAVKFLDVPRDSRILLGNYLQQKLNENGPSARPGPVFKRL